MDTTAQTPAPATGSTFLPLPSGVTASVSPERIREQLGWGMLQAHWR